VAIEIDLPQPEFVPVSFVDREPGTRGGQGTTIGEYSDAISLGEPIGVQIDETYAKNDEILALLLRNEQPRSRYVLFRFVVNIADSETARKADRLWLNVTLGDVDAPPGRRPIAYSMDPDIEVELVASKGRKVSFGGDLKLVHADVELNRSADTHAIRAQANRKQTSTPNWMLQPTPVRPFAGDYTLTLISRGPDESRTQATAALQAHFRKGDSMVNAFSDPSLHEALTICA
jgi:predicted transport protein